MLLKYLTAGLVVVHSAHATIPCNAAFFQSIINKHGAPANVSINWATQFAAGDSTFDPSLEFPANATNLPELCGVSINVPSSESSAYNFAVFLPTDWNQRMMTTGNGGFGGGLNYLDMATYSYYGFATVSTDTGHDSNVLDGSWALNEPERIIDWGFRAMHGSVILAKAIVSTYYGGHDAHQSVIQQSYYAGCSTGGRQGLKEIEMYPEDFDGILAGAPAWWTNHIQTWTTHIAQQNLPATKPGHISAAQYAAYVAEFMAQCDNQDGVQDKIVMSPDKCKFDFGSLSCDSPNANKTSCFSHAQLCTLHKMTDSWNAPDGTKLFPGFPPGADPSILTLQANPLGYGFLQWFVYNDTSWDYSTFSYADVQAADHINPGQATANNFDLSAFKHRGGKLIMYHGWADPFIPTGSSDYFYQQVQHTMNRDLNDFFRLFHIPQMGHCAGNAGTSAAPWYIAAANQAIAGVNYSIPGYMDAKHDAVLALMDWVERGIAPDEIIATKFRNDTLNGGVEMQRPLCPWPKVARFVGGVDWHQAECWSCR